MIESTTDAVEVPETLIDDVRAQLMILNRQGGRYAGAYFRHCVVGGPRPPSPTGMHTLVAKMIRDLALDEATVLRMYGPRKETAA